MNKTFLFLSFVIFGIFFYRIYSYPASSDAYWHLATGRQIVDQRKILNKDNFTYASGNPSYVPTEWLSDVIFYGIYQVGGTNWLIMLRVFLGLGVLAILFATFRLFSKNLFLIDSGLAVIAYILASRLNDRPEMFSYLFLVFVNYALVHFYLKDSFNRFFYFLPLIFLLWPNIHPYGIVAYLVFAFWFALLIFERKLEKADQKRSFLVVFLSSSILFFTQYQKVFYFLKAENLRNPELSSFAERITHIKSFQFFQQIPYDIYFFLINVAFFLLVLVILFLRKRLTRSRLLISVFYIAFAISVIKYFRFLPVAMLLIFPWLVYLLAILGSKKKRLSISNLFLYLQFCAAVFLIIFSIVFGYLMGDRTFSLYYLDDSGKPIAVKNRTWLPEYPLAAAKYIQDNLDSKRIYSKVNWNNYLVWSIPDVKVFRTAQPEYLNEQIDRDEGLLLSGKGNWMQILDKYNIDTVVNTNGDQFRTTRVPIFDLKKWNLVYVDDVSAVYARDDVIRKRSVDLSRMRPDLKSPVKFKSEASQEAAKQLKGLLEYDQKNSFGREQLILFYLLGNDLESAKQLAHDSRQILPADPAFSLYLALIYANSGDCDLARGSAQEAKSNSYKDFWIEKRLDVALSVKCNF